MVLNLDDKELGFYKMIYLGGSFPHEWYEIDVYDQNCSLAISHEIEGEERIKGYTSCLDDLGYKMR